MPTRYALSIEVGGTFTDLALVDPERGAPAARRRPPGPGWGGRHARDAGPGRGQWRGAFGALPGHARPVAFFLKPDRLHLPPVGLRGGEDGPLAGIVVNGQPLPPDELGSGQITLHSEEDRPELLLPGGTSYGPPGERDPAARAADARAGLVIGEYS